MINSTGPKGGPPPAGVLFANAWESLRRIEERADKESRRQKPSREVLATESARV